MEAQAEMQAVSQTPDKIPSALCFRMPERGRFFSARRAAQTSRLRRTTAEPASVPTTAAKESSKPMSQTA